MTDGIVSQETPHAVHITLQLQDRRGAVIHTHHCTCQLGIYTEEQARNLGGDVFVALWKNIVQLENK